MSFREHAKHWVKTTLLQRGIAVTSANKYGIDPFRDVQRLARLWTYPVKTVFDVGAHHGVVALAALREFPEAQVYSFEPHPSTFAELMNNLAGKPRFHGVNLALGSATGEAEMFEYEFSVINSLAPNAQFVRRFGNKGKSIRVKTTSLDAFCSENSIASIDLLKIDTEGFDVVVLEGSRSALKRRAVKFVYFEFNDLQPRPDAFGGALLPFDSLLRPYGYRFIASYNDKIFTDGEMLGVSNALFALPPESG